MKEKLEELEEKYKFWEKTDKVTSHEGTTECNCGGSCSTCSSGCGDGCSGMD